MVPNDAGRSAVFLRRTRDDQGYASSRKEILVSLERIARTKAKDCDSLDSHGREEHLLLIRERFVVYEQKQVGARLATGFERL